MISMTNPPDDRDDALRGPIDYYWFANRFERLCRRLASLESAVTSIEEAVAAQGGAAPDKEREFYSTQEFGELVGRSEYTVREWCRLQRIHCKKAESGRGDAKSWKIPASELQRYRDHGLLPITYLR